MAALSGETRPKVYLAGPEVFLPDAVATGETKKQLCADYGFEGLYPIDNKIVPDASGTRTDILIYRANVAMMRKADLGILNLTPFRGPSADVGTAFELGMMMALDKPLFAYTNDPGTLLARMQAGQTAYFDAATDRWRDASGMSIEDFGNADNLMIDAALIEQGRPMIRHQAPPLEMFRDMTAFEDCLRMAARIFKPLP